jgi:hypothetical protein
LFRIKTQANADVYLVHNDINIHTKTLADGYFKFCIPLEQCSDYGWIDYEVSIIYKNETIATKKVLLEADAYQAKKDLKIRIERAIAAFRSKERQIFLEIKQQIISLVLKRTVIRAQEAFGPKERATALINDTINKLEGDLL